MSVVKTEQLRESHIQHVVPKPAVLLRTTDEVVPMVFQEVAVAPLRTPIRCVLDKGVAPTTSLAEQGHQPHQLVQPGPSGVQLLHAMRRASAVAGAPVTAPLSAMSRLLLQAKKAGGLGAGVAPLWSTVDILTGGPIGRMAELAHAYFVKK